MPCLVTLVTAFYYDHMCQTCLLFSTHNSLLDSSMRLIYCWVRVSFFFFLTLRRNLMLLLLQGSTTSDATCQPDTLLSMWGRPLSPAAAKYLPPDKNFKFLNLFFNILIAITDCLLHSLRWRRTTTFTVVTNLEKTWSSHQPTGLQERQFKGYTNMGAKCCCCSL